MSYATIRCDTSQYYTPQEAAIQYALKQYVAMQYAVLLYAAERYDTQQYYMPWVGLGRGGAVRRSE
jgi:hypothetical protein